MDELYPHCGALWRRQGGENAHLRRAISRSGLRATDLAREFARYRSVSLGQCGQALPHGTAHHRASLDPAIVKKELHLDASLYTCLQILSVSIFEKTEISCALQPDVTRTIAPPIDNQFTLLEF